MTSNIDFDSIVVEEVDEFPTPNHKASANGNSGREKPPRPPRKTAETKLPPKRKGQFVEPLRNLYGGIGMALTPLDPVCGQAILVSAENCAQTVDTLAYQNDSVRRIVISLTQTSAYGAVFLAHMPILLAVMTHHMPGFADRMQSAGITIAQTAAETMQQNVNENRPAA